MGRSTTFKDHPRRGEIHYVQFPQEENARPAIVVSIDARNRGANDVIVVPISASARPMPSHVFLRRGDGGLRKDSVAKCEQIATVLKVWLIEGPLGDRISAASMSALERAIMGAIGIMSNYHASA